MNLKITSLNEAGYGVGQAGGQTLTVARTAPGDEVTVGPPRSKSRWSSADLAAVVRPGPDRVDPACAAFDQGCGGCQWLHLSAGAQAHWKQKNLEAQLRARADFRGTLNPLVASPAAQGYRNKLSLKNAGGRFVFVAETGGRALSPESCRVQTPVLQTAWEALRLRKVPPFLDQLHLRSNAAGQVGMHAFVADRSPGLEEALRSWAAAVPGTLGAGATNRSGYRLISGQEYLPQTSGATTWLVPHNGFFQTNEALVATLVEVVARHARLGSGDRLLDLYCGAGFFALALASRVRETVGIEENPQAVAAAEAGARASSLSGVRFLAGDLGAVLDQVPREGDEVAVVDPPREGLLPRARELLTARRPKRIVYVSCHPESLLRDLKVLTTAGWRASSATAVDLFPHTSHLETVVTLERTS